MLLGSQKLHGCPVFTPPHFLIDEETKPSFHAFIGKVVGSLEKTKQNSPSGTVEIGKLLWVEV